MARHFLDTRYEGQGTRLNLLPLLFTNHTSGGMLLQMIHGGCDVVDDNEDYYHYFDYSRILDCWTTAAS